MEPAETTTACGTGTTTSSTPIHVLTLSAVRYLAGGRENIASVLDKHWHGAPNVPPNVINSGVDVDIDNIANTIRQVRESVAVRHYEGVIFGWCIRGRQEFTEPFEELLQAVAEEVGGRSALIFCTGPDDLVNAVVRNIPKKKDPLW